MGIETKRQKKCCFENEVTCTCMSFLKNKKIVISTYISVDTFNVDAVV